MQDFPFDAPLLRPWPWQRAADAMPGLAETAAFGDNPGRLRMLSWAPDDLPRGSPLVVVLHGCTQTAAGYAEAAGWGALAARHGFALLVPEQTRANNPNLCFDWFQPQDVVRGQGEAASIRSMVLHLLSVSGLDEGRVFITGLSAGGAMAGAMLAAYPELFAGGAIVAGLPFGCAANVQEAFAAMRHAVSRPGRAWGDMVRAASPHQGPWPRVCVWHGLADRTVDPANAREIVKQWLDVHGLGGAPAIRERVDGSTRRVWPAPDGRPAIEAWLIPGMDHGTPVAPRAADPEQACGSAAPYVLDVGIASSLRTAAFWGLIEPGRSTAARPLPPSAPPAAGRFDPVPAIAGALRRAGLLGGH